MMKIVLAFSVLLATVLAEAGEKVEYKSGGVTLEGYLAWPDTKGLNNPAVLIVHDWMGPSDFTRQKADEMAKMGYVAFAADIYGKDVRPKDGKEAGLISGKFKNDVGLLRKRIQAGLDVLLKQRGVNKDHVVAFGYCFGGQAVLELARTGAKVAGIVSFHGGMPQGKPEETAKIKSKVLILHGAIDPHTSAKDVMTFAETMEEKKIDYQVIFYSGAVHAFAVPSAGNDIKTGAAYDAKADRRSWQAFQDFLKEVTPL